MAVRPPPSGGIGAGEGAGASGTARWFAVTAGVALLVLGLAGSFANPIVGRPEVGPLLVTGPGHDIVHLVLGALLVHLGVGLVGRQRDGALLVLGAVIVGTGLVSLVSPDLLGLYGSPTSTLDQLGHLAIGAAAMALGWLGRTGGTPRARGTRPRRAARTG